MVRREFLWNLSKESSYNVAWSDAIREKVSFSKMPFFSPHNRFLSAHKVSQRRFFSPIEFPSCNKCVIFLKVVRRAEACIAVLL